jgi:hypothetical protein
VGIVGKIKISEIPRKTGAFSIPRADGHRRTKRIVPVPIKNPGFLPFLRHQRENSFTGGGCVSMPLNSFPLSTMPQGFAEKKFVHAALLSG